MEESRNAKLIIRYVDGQSNRVVFSQPVGSANAMKRLEEGMSARVLILELEDRVMIIPIEQIKSLEIYPAPEVLPQYALRGVRFEE